MATVEVINMNGEKTGEIDLKDNIFGIEANQNAMHTAVIYYLANQRQGTKCTKTRAEVRGGGRKPWRQKGTGRARQGSIRSPQWRKGGIVFAPKPRDFSFKINKKLKRLAIKSALSTRLSEKKLIVMDKLELDEIKTKLTGSVTQANGYEKQLTQKRAEAEKKMKGQAEDAAKKATQQATDNAKKELGNQLKKFF